VVLITLINANNKSGFKSLEMKLGVLGKIGMIPQKPGIYYIP